MSRLGNFLGKPSELDLGELGKFNVYPLKVRDMVLFKENPTPDEVIRINRELIRKSLVDEKDITDAEIDALPLEVFMSLINKISEINGFNEQTSRIGKIKEEIARRRTGQ